MAQVIAINLDSIINLQVDILFYIIISIENSSASWALVMSRLKPLPSTVTMEDVIAFCSGNWYLRVIFEKR